MQRPDRGGGGACNRAPRCKAAPLNSPPPKHRSFPLQKKKKNSDPTRPDTKGASAPPSYHCKSQPRPRSCAAGIQQALRSGWLLFLPGPVTKAPARSQFFLLSRSGGSFRFPYSCKKKKKGRQEKKTPPNSRFPPPSFLLPPPVGIAQVGRLPRLAEGENGLQSAAPPPREAPDPLPSSSSRRVNRGGFEPADAPRLFPGPSASLRRFHCLRHEVPSASALPSQRPSLRLPAN